MSVSCERNNLASQWPLRRNESLHKKMKLQIWHFHCFPMVHYLEITNGAKTRTAPQPYSSARSSLSWFRKKRFSICWTSSLLTSNFLISYVELIIICIFLFVSLLRLNWYEFEQIKLTADRVKDSLQCWQKQNLGLWFSLSSLQKNKGNFVQKEQSAQKSIYSENRL